MKNESLNGLRLAFEEWRDRKRYRQEAIPAGLLERARRAARHHGPTAVARVTKVDRGRLQTGDGGRDTKRSVSADAPTFSHLKLGAQTLQAQPFAEVEMATGMKVRLFAQSDEVLGLLTSLVRLGGVQ